MKLKRCFPRIGRIPSRPIAEPLEERSLLTTAVATGSILSEYWKGVSGTTLSALNSDSKYPNNPSGAKLLTSFEAPALSTGSIGERIRGLVSPPESGVYTFYISGDANAQLFLSNDTTPANDHAIASVAGTTAARQYTKSASQQSTGIFLNAGSSYYIEADSAGTGSLSVAWQMPDGTFAGPIGGQFLSPITPTVQIWDTQPIAAEGDSVPAIFTVSRTGGPTALPTTVNYSVSGAATNGVDYQKLSGSVTIPAGAASAPINVYAINDHLTEGNESIAIKLIAGSGYTLSDPSAITTAGTILSNSNIPAGGRSLTPADPLGGFSFVGNTPSGKSSRVGVSGAPFSSALLVQMTATSSSGYTFQFVEPTTASFAQGDTLYVQFYARTMNSDGSAVQFTTGFEKSASPNTSLISYQNSAGVNWRKYEVPIKANAAYAAGAARLNFRFTNLSQSIEIGGISVLDFGTAVTASSLPTTPIVYDNNFNDAWRASANTSIDQIRQANLSVTVTDSAGNPIPGAVVKVQQVNQSFGFGAALNGDSLLKDPTTHSDTYHALVAQMLNRATLEFNLKWPFFDSDPQYAIQAVDWVIDSGLNLRGHNLVWPSWANMPAWVHTDYLAIFNNKSQGPAAAATWLQQTIISHIQSEVKTFAGEPQEWDVVNEPYTNHDAIDVLGKSAVVAWYKTAHAADPNARLFINDFGIIGGTSGHISNFYTWIQYLLGQGAPLQGIGEESHFGPLPPTISQVQAFFTQFGQFNIPIEATEFDVNTTNEQLQADYARDYMTFIFSQPLATGFTAWDFWALRSNLPNGALFRNDFSLRPWGQVWKDLIFNDWSTNTQGTTFGNGQYNTSAFQGTLDVTATMGGVTKTVRVSLTPGGTNVSIALPDSAHPSPLTTSATHVTHAVSVSWTDHAHTAKKYVVERSTDGSNFTPIAMLPTSATGYVDITVSAQSTYFYRVLGIGNTVATSYSMQIQITTPVLPNYFTANADIGSPTLAGSSSYAGGTYTVSGAGSDIGIPHDQFHYDYTTLTGDSTIEARVTSITNTDPSAKAGIMMRANTTSTSAFASLSVTPSNTVIFQYRTIAGGTVGVITYTARTMPQWIRLTTAGNAISALVSNDGLVWEQIYPIVTITKSASVLAGLAVTSRVTSKQATATFDNVTVTPGVLAIPGAT